MKKLYAPWREEYSEKIGNGKTEKTTEQECAFCIRLKEKNDNLNEKENTIWEVKVSYSKKMNLKMR